MVNPSGCEILVEFTPYMCKPYQKVIETELTPIEWYKKYKAEKGKYDKTQIRIISIQENERRFMDISQTHDLEQTMNTAKKYAGKGHTVKIRLQDFHEDSEEHKALEWEVAVDFDDYLCHGCNHMKVESLHGIVEYDDNNYCDECAKNLVVEV